MTSTVLAEAEMLNELPIPPIAFGLIAFAVLLGLLLITWSFRSIGTRPTGKSAGPGMDAGHDDAHGHGH